MLLIKKMNNGMRIYRQKDTHWVKNTDGAIVAEFQDQASAEAFCEDSSSEVTATLQPRSGV